MNRILVIEDNQQSARLVTKLLVRGGFNVAAAETGEDGLTDAFENKPDLVLIDLGLPDIDGQTVIALMRQQPSLNAVPIIAFTAWPEETAHQMARAYGCDGVITKPLDTRSFIDKIKVYLNQAPGVLPT